jgi:hypothetical protein
MEESGESGIVSPRRKSKRLPPSGRGNHPITAQGGVPPSKGFGCSFGGNDSVFYTLHPKTNSSFQVCAVVAAIVSAAAANPFVVIVLVSTFAALPTLVWIDF